METRLITAQILFEFEMELDGSEEGRKANSLWSMSPENEGIKLYQVLMEPDLWVKLKRRV